MEEIHGLFRTAGIREILTAAEKTGQHALGFIVDSSAYDGDFYVSMVGTVTGVDLDAELRALTRVLTGAGYEVAPDPEDEHGTVVIARLVSAP
jgi:hypothetical protein